MYHMFGSKKGWIPRLIFENYRYFTGIFWTEVKPLSHRNMISQHQGISRTVQTGIVGSHPRGVRVLPSKPPWTTPGFHNLREVSEIPEGRAEASWSILEYAHLEPVGLEHRYPGVQCSNESNKGCKRQSDIQGVEDGINAAEHLDK
mgnify:CR=1 FL=1